MVRGGLAIAIIASAWLLQSCTTSSQDSGLAYVDICADPPAERAARHANPNMPRATITDMVSYADKEAVLAPAVLVDPITGVAVMNFRDVEMTTCLPEKLVREFQETASAEATEDLIDALIPTLPSAVGAQMLGAIGRKAERAIPALTVGAYEEYCLLMGGQAHVGPVEMSHSLAVSTLQGVRVRGYPGEGWAPWDGFSPENCGAARPFEP